LLDKIDELNFFKISDIRRQMSIGSISINTNVYREKGHLLIAFSSSLFKG
jgi:hypothetical protein